MGWSIFSALKKYRDDNEEENESKLLLSSMIILEEDADEEYLAKYYDTNMSMVNCGGLTLVSSYFFEWGKDAMEVIRNAFTQERMKQNLRSCFKDGKHLVMHNSSIHSKFESLCQSPSMNFQQDAIEEVYQIILRKMIHSRFAVVFRQWKEQHCQKHDMSLRSNLKAGVDKNKKSKVTKQPTTPHPAGVDKKLSNDTKRPATPHPAGIDNNKKSKETQRDATPNTRGSKTSNDTKRPAAPHPDAQIDVKKLKTS